MLKEIKYQGIAANPSDYDCNDGELSLSLNVLPERGALRPLMQPRQMFDFTPPLKVVYIHQTTQFRHYVILNHETGLSTVEDAEDMSAVYDLYQFGSEEIYRFDAIGNTLVALTSIGLRYFLWKNEEEGYLHLGTHLPELPLSFGLQGEFVRGEDQVTEILDFKPGVEFAFAFYKFNEMPSGFLEKKQGVDFDDDTKRIVTEQVLAKVNKFIADESTNKGRFLYPFFVRYAYRLYDGSLTMHSAPILMVCSSELAPYPVITAIDGLGNVHAPIKKIFYHLEAAFCQLDFACVSQEAIDELKKWKGIVKSVDIFISAPIYTYDQSGECKGIGSQLSSRDFSILKLTNQKASEQDYPKKYQIMPFWKMAAVALNQVSEDGELLVYPFYIDLPRHDSESLTGSLRDNAHFYFLKSYSLEDLPTSRTVIDVPDDYLQSLVNREVMTDDYDSHDQLIPRYSFPYNSRLQLAGLSKHLFQGYHACQLSSFCEGALQSGIESYDYEQNTFRAYYFIRQDGKEIVLQGEPFQMGALTPIMFLFYPNTNAYKCVLERTYQQQGGTLLLKKYREYTLSPHDFLNGAYYSEGFNSFALWPPYGAEPPVPSQDTVISLPNKVYASEVNNPFFFPLSGIYTVGTGEIMGISAAAKALSQGQFGQFPLYAFATDGVWALEVSETGTYIARQPITREVCLSPTSITQVDTAVLFATNRGIMHISGSNVQCLSDQLREDQLYVDDGKDSLSVLPAFSEILKAYNDKAYPEERITALDIIPFRDFLQGCSMAYDYINQRVYVYNPSVPYAYVLAMDTRLWGMVRSSLTDTLNAYPDSLAMAAYQGRNTLVNISFPDVNDASVLFLTRPLKLGSPDLLKTIDTVIQRGHVARAHLAQALYASRDLIHWHLVWSSRDIYLRGFRGTPYKYFRLAVVGTVHQKESVYGATISLTPRLNNRPR